MNPEQALALLKLIADLYNVINTASTAASPPVVPADASVADNDFQDLKVSV